jgi:nitrogen fixation protein FixH
MNGSIKIALAAAVLAGLAVVAATLWIGARTREETVVAKPYEEGLGLDADQRARVALGLVISLQDGAPEAERPPLAFLVADREGRPVDDAAVTVEISRPETGRDTRAAGAQPQGEGRYTADLAFPARGPWDVRFDVRRGGDRVRVERRVEVSEACDLGAGPCTHPLPGGGEVTVELGPRPLETLRDLDVRVDLRGVPERAEASLSFSMRGMDMGENRPALAPAGPGRFLGKGVLVPCPSGRREWVADVSVASPGAPPRSARFFLTVAK